MNVSEFSTLKDRSREGPTMTPRPPLERRVEASGGYRLSYEQKLHWFLSELASDNSEHRVVAAVRIASEIETGALRRALDRLVHSHPALRTTFTFTNGELFQRVEGSREPTFEEEEVSDLSEAEFEERLSAEAVRPVNQRERPQVHLRLFHRSHDEKILVLSVSPLVADHASLSILMDQLSALYAQERGSTADGESLSPPPFEYADYAGWQEAMLAGPRGEQLREYWLKQCSAFSVLNLPTDRPRRTSLGQQNSVACQLGPACTRRLKEYCGQHQSALDVMILTAFAVLLHRYSEQEDFLIGIPTTARTEHAQLEGLVGNLVNYLPLKIDLSDDPIFAGFLSRMGQTLREGQE